VRWLRDDQLHLTLAFVGAMPPDQLPTLVAALADLAAASAPFEFRLGRAGRFGGRGRQEVAWIGLADGHAACVDLADRAIAACRAVGVLEAPAAGRRDPVARPHLTVARRATPGLPAAIEDALGTRPLGWRADELVLYRSHLGPPRVRYEALARLPLGHDLPPTGTPG
jgi:2'-5' RNA ligase